MFWQGGPIEKVLLGSPDRNRSRDPGALHRMTDKKVYRQPSDVSVKDGVVRVQGPDAVDIQMTAEAADETSERLLYGAMQALGRKIPEAEREEKPTEEPETAD